MADPRKRRPRRGTTIDPARLAAYDVLTAVREDEAYANLVLPSVLERHGLSGRDAGFATELASGAIRRRGTYDAIIAGCINRPLAKVDPALLDVLRLGAHQLLAMRVPDHAALNSSVELARSKVGQSTAGFANAVLRRITEHELTSWIRRVAPEDTIGFASVAYSHPTWIVEELSRALTACGAPDDELDSLLLADNAPPRVTLVARPGLAEVAELMVDGATASQASPIGVDLAGGLPSDVPAVAEGRAGVQDAGSQLVALALAEATLGGRDLEWLDVCAGPGGKAALLAALARQRGAKVLANERLPHRAGLVRRAVTPVLGGIRGVVVADGTTPAWPTSSFDRVLVDAPCSGLGALRRRPESRWRRTQTDVDELVPLQRDLLNAALDSTRPGGLTLYATCSPVLAETRDVVRSVLEARSDVTLEDASRIGAIAGLDAPGPLPGTVQLWPHRHGTDAMFLALLRRS